MLSTNNNSLNITYTNNILQTAQNSSQDCFSILPKALFEDFFLAFFTPEDWSHTASVNKYFHAQSLTAMVKWLNAGNPVTDLGKTGKQFESFFSRPDIKQRVLFLNMEENFSLFSQKGIKDILQYIDYCPNIQSLKLVKCTISAKHIDLMIKAKFNLKLIHFEENSFKNLFNDRALPSLITLLEANPGLQSLCLAGNCIPIKDLLLFEKAIRGMSNLHHLDLSRNHLCKYAEETNVLGLAILIEEKVELKSLNLSHNYIDSYCFNILAKGIGMITTLQELDLSWNWPATKELATEMVKLTSLQKLNLSGMATGRISLMPILEILLHFPKLQSLNLSDNHLDSQAIRTLTIALKVLTELKLLDLSQNNINNIESISLLADALKEGLPNLEDLTLFEYPEIEHCFEGTIILLKSLEKHSLKKLNLRENRLGDSCVIELAHYLQNSPPILEKLNLANCWRIGVIPDEAVHLLAQGLVKQQSLNDIRLPENFFTTAQDRKIIEAMGKIAYYRDLWKKQEEKRLNKITNKD